MFIILGTTIQHHLDELLYIIICVTFKSCLFNASTHLWQQFLILHSTVGGKKWGMWMWQSSSDLSYREHSENTLPSFWCLRKRNLNLLVTHRVYRSQPTRVTKPINVSIYKLQHFKCSFNTYCTILKLLARKLPKAWHLMRMLPVCANNNILNEFCHQCFANIGKASLFV